MLARTLKISVAAMILGAATPLTAEILSVNGQISVKPANMELPERGTSMAAVEAKYGQPNEKSGPVGNPAITKWVYLQFTVVFENDKVLHAVVTPG